MASELDILTRRIEREQKARSQAEIILEQKATELYQANERLKQWNDSLEKEIKSQTLQIRESEEKYRGIIENMELGLLEVDNNDIITKVYNHFCMMVGYTAEELVGKKASDVFLDETLSPLISAHNEQRKKGISEVYEIPIRTKNGTILWALVSGAPIHNLKGEVVGSIGIHYNISEKKKLIEELASAKHIAEEAQRAEKQFLANMSHEIRTPLNAIIGMAHLLYDTKPTTEQREYLDVLKNSSNFLHALISDILDMSKIEAGRIEPNLKEIDLLGLVRTQQKAFELKIEGRPIEIEAMIDTRLEGYYWGDELLINQVLNNLLSNAEKFTQKGTISISVKQVHQQAKDVVFQFKISDTGEGIDETNVGAIFEKFKQINTENHQKIKGTGLGLAITKQLVEQMGGEISVESQKGEGTTFAFTLPFERSNATTIVTAKTQKNIVALDKSLQEIYVLVVEDNAMNRKYLGTLLQKWNVRFDCAINGREALTLIQNHKYDMILMDIQMPIMNGYEATLAIRNTANLNQFTPIIALTASAIASERNQAFEVGMNDFLSKPFTPTQLQEKLFANQSAIAETPADTIIPKIVAGELKLNQAALTDMYGNDKAYQAEMFGIFLKDVLPEIKVLPALIGDLDKLKSALHKLKPTFVMVGLDHIEQEVSNAEKKLINHQLSSNELSAITEQIVANVKQYLPLIEAIYEEN